MNTVYYQPTADHPGDLVKVKISTSAKGPDAQDCRIRGLIPYSSDAKDNKSCFYDNNICHFTFITWRPVGTCFASFTLAKLPRPIVLIKRYFPICCKSSGGLARSALLRDAFCGDV